MNAIGYLRVSGKTQVDGDGFPRQEESVKAFCAANGLTLLECYQEKGVSGTIESMDRPAFSQLIAERKADIIVVERMDRLARDLMISELLLRECRQAGIKVYAADQGACIDMASDDGDPTRKLIRQVLGAVAEWEKSALVKKLYAAKKRLNRMGGELPYGAKPGEPAILRTMLAWRREGQSYRQICNSLNDLGFPSRYGSPWNPGCVYVILQRNRDREEDLMKM